MPIDQLLVVVVLLLLLLHRSFSIAVENIQCRTSCGEVTNIRSPFRVRGDPKSCGDPDYELACINNRTVLDWRSGQYYLRSISYTRHTVRVVDVRLQKGNCSSLPLSSPPYGYSKAYSFEGISSLMVIVSCTKAVNSRLYKDASPCLDWLPFSKFSSTGRRMYAVMANTYFIASYVETGCTIEFKVDIPSSIDGYHLRSYRQIHERLAHGYELSWDPTNRKADQIQSSRIERTRRYFSRIAEDILHANEFACLHFRLCWPGRIDLYLLKNLLPASAGDIALACMAVKFILGALCVMMLLICKWRRRHLAMDPNIEEFLQSNNNFLPIRYSYSDIKKITNGLKEKLGEGGYGSVFKGRLRSGHEVAVKILKKGKANGQDFINEVATIGRIHHFNVIGLIGYCFEGSKQALVYDFMHNGSLDKHIFSRVDGTSFDCKEVYKIALGVVRGIEYLHQGCDVQILHFDIKPHNILLDRKFTPKVSDFGLARLYPTNYNTVSLTAARGTFGYMAPELIYKNLGGVSYKADVYSFGKLLIEMASGRKNCDAVIGCSSLTYFPLWVHNQLSEGLDIQVEQVSEEDNRIIKKMIIVALWCIQWDPRDRPSMCKILEMLEREAEDLQIPPKPLF